jgi:acyl-CoA synthetase (AMP-forming)/AMP-acid ligase II
VINTLDSLIGQPREIPPDRAAIVTADVRTTWGELSQLVSSATNALSELRGQRVGILHRGDPPSWAALTALDRLAADVFLLNASLPTDEIRRLADDFQFAAVVEPQTSSTESPWRIEKVRPSPGSGQSSVTILTSGTTGKPKAARHTWASLCRPVRLTQEAEPAAWLLTYRPYLYAGLQVSLQCFASGATLVNPGTAPLDRVVELMTSERVGCVSATPSYWRQLLIFSPPEALSKVKLRQITLGGEAIDQHVLDMLKQAFPKARLVHIYATTELGRCFSVTDGRAGFPAKFLDAVSPDGVELRVEDGELQVRSANAMRGYDALSGVINQAADWFATGDLVRREDDRYYFIGRESDIINVGGNKVSPQEVEQVLRAVPGVADVRVYAKSSSIVGQLAAAQIVPLCAQDSATVKAAVIEASVRQLTPQQRPRLIEIVDRIELSEAGKTQRR